MEIFDSTSTAQPPPLPLVLSEPSFNDLVKCSFCESKFSEESALQRHIKLLHLMKKCPICKESLETKKELEKHIDTSHEGLTAYHCLNCDAAFMKERNLKDHIAKVHEGKPKTKHLCPHCGKMLSGVTSYQRHLVSKVTNTEWNT